MSKITKNSTGLFQFSVWGGGQLDVPAGLLVLFVAAVAASALRELLPSARPYASASAWAA